MATITNRFNLPQPLVDAVKNDPYTGGGDISCTKLIGPPKIRVLTMRHFDEITEDASDRIWSLLGQSVHHVLSRANTDNHLSEERMHLSCRGWKVSGQLDLYTEGGLLSDYKVTSTFSFLLGEKPEWTAQLNVLAAILRRNGFPVKKLSIVAILRDWQSSKVVQDPDYPKAPAMSVDIPLWDNLVAAEYIDSRVLLHQAADKMEDDAIPVCTSEERWDRPTTFASMKPGAKRATRVFETQAEADEHAKANGLTVSVRPGESIRCARFCSVNRFCNFFSSRKDNP